jgi:hypothetical protein
MVARAMEAGLTDCVLTMNELIALLQKPMVSRSRIDNDLFRGTLGETA